MKRILQVLLALFCLLVLAQAVLAETAKASVYAIDTEGKAMSADLVLEIEKGDGEVYTNTTPLVGTTTQNAAKEAIYALAAYFPSKVKEYDFKYSIISNASLVEGPSAGAAMALLAYSLLSGKSIPAEVSITGTISRDGFVGPVGGVFEKSHKASETGIKLFMIPKGEARQIVNLPVEGIKKIDLIAYATENWNLKVVEVATLDEVITLAFTPIQEIEVVEGTPLEDIEFEPKPITASEKLMPVREITSKFIQETELLMAQAKTSINATLLNEPSLINELLFRLQRADETLKQAKLQLDANYLYSAANSAFIAKVETMLVENIAENPSLVALDSSTVFDLKLSELEQLIQELEEDFKGPTPKEGLEWFVSGQQRLGWAKNNLVKLKTTQTIIVSESKEEAYAEILSRLEDFEFANAWASVAKDFLGIAKKSKQFILIEQDYKPTAEKHLAEAENAFTANGEEDLEDIGRRVNGARIAFDNNWLFSTTFDSLSALALVNAKKITAEKTLEEGRDILTQKINELTATLDGSKREQYWARLYLDHARYFLNAADFFKEKNLRAKEVESINNGISLVYLAENTFIAAEEVYDYAWQKKSFTIAEATKAAEKPFALEDERYLLFLAIQMALIVLLFVVIILLLYNFHKFLEQRKIYSIPKQMQHITRLKERLKQDFNSGIISKDVFERINAKYDEELKQLDKEKKDKALHLLELDKLRGELFSVEHVLHGLKSHYHEGVISKEDYAKQINEYIKKIAELKEKIKAEKQALLKEKTELAEVYELVETVKKEEKKTKRKK